MTVFLSADGFNTLWPIRMRQEQGTWRCLTWHALVLTAEPALVADEQKKMFDRFDAVLDKRNTFLSPGAIQNLLLAGADGTALLGCSAARRTILPVSATTAAATAAAPIALNRGTAKITAAGDDEPPAGRSRDEADEAHPLALPTLGDNDPSIPCASDASEKSVLAARQAAFFAHLASMAEEANAAPAVRLPFAQQLQQRLKQTKPA